MPDAGVPLAPLARNGASQGCSHDELLKHLRRREQLLKHLRFSVGGFSGVKGTITGRASLLKNLTKLFAELREATLGLIELEQARRSMGDSTALSWEGDAYLPRLQVRRCMAACTTPLAA